MTNGTYMYTWLLVTHIIRNG